MSKNAYVAFSLVQFGNKTNSDHLEKCFTYLQVCNNRCIIIYIQSTISLRLHVHIMGIPIIDIILMNISKAPQ
jgi:hypothetical protein